MPFSLFGKKHNTSAVVIDIGSTSIAGAYVRFPGSASPVVDFSLRMPIEVPDDGTRPDVYLQRALHTLVSALIETGLAAFARQGGHYPTRVYVSIGAPWQTTSIETETIAPEKPFIFSEGMLSAALKRQPDLAKGLRILQKEVVATLLNGYETPEPVGKKTARAEILTLSSLIDGELMSLISKEAKRLMPTDGILIAPFQSLAYAVLRAQYPYEKEFVLMRVSGQVTSLLFTSRGLITHAAQVPVGLKDIEGLLDMQMRTLSINEGPAVIATKLAPRDAGHAWMEGVRAGLKEYTARHALPRIMYLVAPEFASPTLKRLLDDPELHALWLSDEPLTVIPVISRLLSSLIQHQGGAQPDVMLDLIVLFARLRIEGKK